MFKANMDLSVLLIFFARPNTFSKVFEAVKKARPSKLFLACDGARDGNTKDVDGIEQCKAALTKAKLGVLDANFIEGMACVDGCIGGAGCLKHGAKNKASVDKYGKEALETNIHSSLKNIMKK